MAYLGSTPASAVLSSEDIAAGAVTLNDINFTDQPTNMDITGVIDKHTMRLADGVTITGDVTISDDLVLSKISDDGNAITMTNDGSSRTITGSGSIEASTLSQTPNQSLTGMTGTIGSGVNLKLARNEGLIVKYVSATTVDIDADYLTVFDSNSYGAILPAVNLTATITSSGVNGLDTGSEVAIWYHIYVIYNGTTVASLLSASATSPTMPSGYTHKKYVGAVYNNASSNFDDFFQRNTRVSVNPTAWISNYTSNSYTSSTAPVPTTATSITLTPNLNSASNAGEFYIGHTTTDSTNTKFRVYDGAINGVEAFWGHNFEFIFRADQTVKYRAVSGEGTNFTISYTGWTLPIAI